MKRYCRATPANIPRNRSGRTRRQRERDAFWRWLHKLWWESPFPFTHFESEQIHADANHTYGFTATATMPGLAANDHGSVRRADPGMGFQTLADPSLVPRLRRPVD